MGTSESKWRKITSGVSQGSILGPLLFVIYINDLPDKIKNIMEMYADDSKVISEGSKTSQSELQADINTIDNWCRKWSMSLNSKKCKIMYYGKKNPRNKYYIQH